MRLESLKNASDFKRHAQVVDNFRYLLDRANHRKQSPRRGLNADMAFTKRMTAIFAGAAYPLPRR